MFPMRDTQVAYIFAAGCRSSLDTAKSSALLKVVEAKQVPGLHTQQTWQVEIADDETLSLYLAQAYKSNTWSFVTGWIHTGQEVSLEEAEKLLAKSLRHTETVMRASNRRMTALMAGLSAGMLLFFVVFFGPFFWTSRQEYLAHASASITGILESALIRSAIIIGGGWLIGLVISRLYSNRQWLKSAVGQATAACSQMLIAD